MATTVQSRKSKGRTLQKMVVASILNTFSFLKPDDVRSTSMGAPGEDVTLSTEARKVLPISIECKNVEKLNIWNAYDQAKANAKNWIPVLVFKRNRHNPLVCISLEYFLEIHADCDKLGKLVEELKQKAK